MANKMNTTERIADIIAMLEDGISFEDWGAIEGAVKELNFLYEEMDSSFPLDNYENEFE
jgi:hypothetical protein